VVGNSFQTGLPGIYTVTATSSQGCTARDTFNLDFANRITINAIASDTVLTCDETIELNVTGADSYFWQPATGLNDQNSNNPVVEGIRNSILYVVTGTKGNCTAIDSVNIAFEACSDIYIPNAFSPNGDGVNDIFRVLGSNIKEFNLRIYNRWGTLLFETGQVDAGWDGKYNEKDVTAGVYVWLLDAKDTNGKVLNFNGNFSGNFSLFR
jgi:gliding motility-associated-like protein